MKNSLKKLLLLVGLVSATCFVEAGWGLESTAYHEAGHALLSLFVPQCRSLDRVNIIPNGSTAGECIYLPMSDEEKGRLRDQPTSQALPLIIGLTAGRVAEELVFGRADGYQSDYKYATDLAQLICNYEISFSAERDFLIQKKENTAKEFSAKQLHVASSERIRGHLRNLAKSADCPSPYNYGSNDTEQMYSSNQLVKDCYQVATDVLRKNRMALDMVAQKLLAKKELNANQVRALVHNATLTANCRMHSRL
ncbi:hypothetical protein A3F06_01365 [candidate division TM6 bacterium RIFCSPHIGHO2_12_FULL_36_22]|nr:MAG: hypothetical protein A3F06_01365 [candidate division TM6 bacterium RIFCSPHIGHO2_12_FULL_36_22]